MAIDLLNVEPNQVSADLNGKIVTFFGAYKSGKTFNACKFPNPILLATEKGYGAIPGIHAVPINRWYDLKSAVRQLGNEAVKSKYQTVIIDTVDLAYNLCEKYVCETEGVDKISDVAWGGGYKILREEFHDLLKEIALLNYGLVLISHSFDKTITREDGTQYTRVVSTLNDKAKDIVFGMSDILGYARTMTTESGNKIYLFLRETPQFEAGARWEYVPDKIEFTYENLVKVVQEAVERASTSYGSEYVTAAKQNMYIENTVDFESVMEETKNVIGEILAIKESMSAEITDIVEKHLGHDRKLRDCTKEQAQAVMLIRDDLKKLHSDLI